MTKKLIIAVVSVLLTVTAHSKKDENENHDQDDGRIIICTDKSTAENILQFHSNQLQGIVTTKDYDLMVKTRGDDIAEMTILDTHSKVSIKAKRLEELLKSTLINDAANPIILEIPTHKGYAQAQIVDPNSNSAAVITSVSRRGTSRMEIIFKTADKSDFAMNIVCQKM